DSRLRGMTSCWLSFLYFALLLPLAKATFREQSVAVKGIVNCRGVRQPGAFVQLYDEDSIPLFDSDDLLGSVTADERGIFCVRGATTE
ncbi:Transthyretin-like family protein, partial [Oesophagostomum dentatum]